MYALRCTHKLLKRMGTAPAAEAPAPTTRLGDWYANLLYTPAGQLVLAVCERTLLPVLVPAKESHTLTSRLPQAVREMLVALGVGETVADTEVAAMREVVVGRTASRHVLGTMNDFAFMLEGSIRAEPDSPALWWARELAQSPCSPIGMQRPCDVTLEYLAMLVK